MSRRWNSAISAFLGGLAVAVVAFVAHVTTPPPSTTARERELRKKIEHTCAVGRGGLVGVRHKLRNNDADAVDVAKDFLVFGQPWISLCGKAPLATQYLEADRTRLLEILDDIERSLP